VKRIILCLAILFLVGCTAGNEIKHSDIDATTKELKQTFTTIKDVEVQYFLEQIEWIVTWKNTPTEQEAQAAFQVIQATVQSSNFSEDIVEALVSEHTLKTYPDVVLFYDFEQNDTYDQRYSSAYDTSQGGYTKWYWSEKNDGDSLEVKEKDVMK
jgi:hypothetical protein